ncbi:MAG: class I SAM-dependent methyltransferase [Planctomycetes bacterium]|nr:class I SAM-dependent methyltransferase [Planctomycetota bacterium]
MTVHDIDWNERYETRDTPWDSGEASRELARILDAGLVRPCRAFEVGCGTGTNAVELARRGFEVTGVDVSPLAVEQARHRVEEAKARVTLAVADIVEPGVLGGVVPAGPYEFVFDRGVYHHLRRVALFGFLKALERLTSPGALYLTLAGNANEESPVLGGPPQVFAHDLCKELAPLFEVVQLREFRFDGVHVDGKLISPLAWSALLRRR